MQFFLENNQLLAQLKLSSDYILKQSLKKKSFYGK